MKSVMLILLLGLLLLAGAASASVAVVLNTGATVYYDDPINIVDDDGISEPVELTPETFQPEPLPVFIDVGSSIYEPEPDGIMFATSTDGDIGTIIITDTGIFIRIYIGDEMITIQGGA